jgi:hypothetical protein
MEEVMGRASFQKIASPADRDEYRKWARRISTFYGILFAGAITFAVVHHYQPRNHADQIAGAHTTASIIPPK